MSTIYKTSDYFTDSHWIFGKVVNIFSKTNVLLKLNLKKVLDFEFESYFLRIIENLPYGLLIMFLGFFLSVFLIRFTENERGMHVYAITTSSMSPAVRPGSLLFSFPSKKYEVGDIVNYKEKNLKNNTFTGRILTHRIIEKRVDEGFYIYTLKGDNNDNPDPGSVKSLDIVGRVFWVMPYFGYIDFLIRTIPGFLVFIAIPSILVILEARRYLKS